MLIRNDFGDIDESFYETLINMLERFTKELKNSSIGKELYVNFRSRLQQMNGTADIGWGYGDFIHDTVNELELLFADK